MKKLALGSKVQLEVLYSNQTKSNLQLEVIYKIPKCFQIEKQSKINRKFTLNDTHQHLFSLDVAEFPLEACLLSVKYRAINNEQGMET